MVCLIADPTIIFYVRTESFHIFVLERYILYKYFLYLDNFCYLLRFSHKKIKSERILGAF